MLVSDMVKSPIDNVVVGEASAAQPPAKRSATSRAGDRRRKADRAQVKKAVTKLGPRRRYGINPNSRLGRRQASPHWQERGTTMSTPLYIGIDVAKDSFQVASCPAQLQGNYSNAPEGHRKLLATLKGLDVAQIILEATGGYERSIAAELIQAGFQAVVVNPRQVRHFAKGLGKNAKTDTIDADVLAMFGQMIKPTYRPPKEPQTQVLAELVSRRRQLVDMLTQETNRAKMPHHAKVRSSIKRMSKTLETQIRQLDELIQKHIQADDDFRNKDAILQSTPGIGPQTSAMLMAELPELGQLNRHEVAALVGLAPFDCQSGNQRRRSRIFGGRKEVRCLLYMAALSAKCCNPQIRNFAERLAHEGKSFKVIITACMRKLLVTVNALIRDQVLWTSEKTPKKA
jgi:transposase